MGIASAGKCAAAPDIRAGAGGAARASVSSTPRGLLLAGAFAAGLQAGSSLHPAARAMASAGILVAAGALARLAGRRSGVVIPSRALREGARSTAFLALGLLRAPAYGPAVHRAEPDEPWAQVVTVEGIVHEPPVETIRDGRGVREVRTLFTLRLAGGEDVRVDCAGRTRGIQGGRLVSATGSLSSSPGPRNPGDRSSGGWRFLEVPHPAAIQAMRGRIEPTFEGITGALRGWIHETLSGVYPEATRGFVLSMILGDRRLLAPEVREALLLTGTFHLLAISGLHVVLIMALLLRVPAPGRAGLPFRLSVLAVFAALTGASPPVLRAAVMFTIEALLELSGRKPRPLDTLGWTAFLLLALDPALLHDIGFQLSFVSVASILTWTARLSFRREPLPAPLAAPSWGGRTCGPVVARILAGVRAAGRALGASLALSAGTSAGTAPLTLIHFQRIHPLGPLWNVLGYPLTLVPVAGGFLTIILAALHPDLARPLAWAVDRLSAALLFPLIAGADLPGSAVFLPPPSAAAAALAYAVLCAGLVTTLRRGVLRGGVAALAILSAGALLAPRHPELWVLDAGAGDAAIVGSPGGGAVLVDAGARGSDVAAGENLRRAILVTGHRSLSGAFLTHAHADHLRGLGGVLARLPLGCVWAPAGFRKSAAGREWSARIEALGIPIHELARGRSVAIGPSMTVEVLHPGLEEPLPLSRSTNDGSLALRVRLGGTRILFLGDLEEEGIARLLGSVAGHETDVLLAPHHGRWNALWPVLLERTRPRTVIISGTGEGGAREMAARLRQDGIQVLATWEGGAVKVSPLPQGGHEARHER